MPSWCSMWISTFPHVKRKACARREGLYNCMINYIYDPAIVERATATVDPFLFRSSIRSFKSLVFMRIGAIHAG